MKRLLIVATLSLVTASATGCWRWFNRGAQCNPCTTAPAVDACADPYLSAPAVDGAALPGPQVTPMYPAN
ncbi:MAG TPA: hypothetical protein VJ783_21195 [Pirellulales bacterium]|nr:hypothetical protein [Pirellulales bacterium]